VVLFWLECGCLTTGKEIKKEVTINRAKEKEMGDIERD
jgi:hypothetical protein